MNTKTLKKPKFRLNELLASYTYEDQKRLLSEIKKKVSRGAIWQIKSAVEGDKYEPDMTTVKHICGVLRVPIEAFYTASPATVK